jgi:hypothetical protein
MELIYLCVLRYEMLTRLCKSSKLLIINMAEILYRIEQTHWKPSSLRLSFGNKKGVLKNNNNNNPCR